MVVVVFSRSVAEREGGRGTTLMGLVEEVVRGRMELVVGWLELELCREEEEGMGCWL